VNEKYNLPAPIAEHGFSALISTFDKNNNNNNTFLFDAGVSETGVIHNADLLEIRFDRIVESSYIFFLPSNYTFKQKTG